ncbi:MAG: arsenite methyltransferase [Calditrichaeota bacterium]|nr:arsenite methyltransferase [Calditrichota bacterium]
MSSAEDLKKIVQDKYADIATQSEKKGCSCGCSKETDYSSFNLDYSNVEGYLADADLNLGCGIPTEFAQISEGNTVVDLGSGAGNDVFVARRLVGETGKVVGIDMTPEMLGKAEKNKQKLGYTNVDFKLGDIENLPLENNFADVVISNCVLNLVPDKNAAFQEIYRVLKPGAHFCVSDIILEGNIPDELKKSAEMYAGCVAGALQKDEYLRIIKQNGFTATEVKKSREIVLPEDVLDTYLDEEAKRKFGKSGVGIFSITVVAKKPGLNS